MPRKPPSVIAIAGPNGAGKSTTAAALLRGKLEVAEFVNADTIARGLSAFEPERAAIAAGKVMISRLRDLARLKVPFTFETTLASRSFAPWIKGLIEQGYRFRLVFLWLPSPDAAVRRVDGRVLTGGDFVPEEIVRRRYAAGLRNFFSLYQPLASEWRIYDNSVLAGPRLICEGRKTKVIRVHDDSAWGAILRESKA